MARRRVTGAVESLELELDALRERVHLVKPHDAQRLLRKIYALQVMLLYRVDQTDAESYADLIESPTKLPEHTPAGR